MILANVAIPTVLMHGIGLALVLPVVILIEGLVLKRRHGVSILKGTELAGRANIISTVVGLPVGYALAIGVLVVVGTLLDEVFVFNTPPLLQSVAVHSVMLGGVVPTFVVPGTAAYLSSIAMLVPYYAATLYVEYRVLVKVMDVPKKALLRTVWQMNLATYVVLFVILLLLLRERVEYDLVHVKAPYSFKYIAMEGEFRQQRQAAERSDVDDDEVGSQRGTEALEQPPDRR